MFGPGRTSTSQMDPGLQLQDGHVVLCPRSDDEGDSVIINFTPALRSASDISVAQTTYTNAEPYYQDYYDYICKIVEQHPDIDALKDYLEQPDDPSKERTAVHVVDFVSSTTNPLHPIIHGVCTNAEEVQTLFDEQDDVVELRLVVVSHEQEIDREILKAVGFELDIDPRVFIEHMGSMFPNPSAYFATPYLPSEAISSPIEIHFGGGKSTAVLLHPEEANVKIVTGMPNIAP